MPSFKTIDAYQLAGKRVILRADLNVPMRDGKVGDLTRLERLAPTIRENFLGNAQILQVFTVTKSGKVAGCRVSEGVVERNTFGVVFGVFSSSSGS